MPSFIEREYEEAEEVIQGHLASIGARGQRKYLNLCLPPRDSTLFQTSTRLSGASEQKGGLQIVLRLGVQCE